LLNLPKPLPAKKKNEEACARGTEGKAENTTKKKLKDIKGRVVHQGGKASKDANQGLGQVEKAIDNMIFPAVGGINRVIARGKEKPAHRGADGTGLLGDLPRPAGHKANVEKNFLRKIRAFDD